MKLKRIEDNITYPPGIGTVIQLHCPHGIFKMYNDGNIWKNILYQCKFFCIDGDSLFAVYYPDGRRELMLQSDDENYREAMYIRFSNALKRHNEQQKERRELLKKKEKRK